MTEMLPKRTLSISFDQATNFYKLRGVSTKKSDVIYTAFVLPALDRRLLPSTMPYSLIQRIKQNYSVTTYTLSNACFISASFIIKRLALHEHIHMTFQLKSVSLDEQAIVRVHGIVNVTFPNISQQEKIEIYTALFMK